MSEIATMERLESEMKKEFPEDQGKIARLFKEKNFLRILDFLDSNKSSVIDPETILIALNSGNTIGLEELAKKEDAKKKRREKFFEACAQMWAKQIKQTY